MTREEALDLLHRYNEFLINAGYAELEDLISYSEPSALDVFTQIPYFKNTYPLVLKV